MRSWCLERFAMSRISDINAKLAYLTRKSNGRPFVKAKRPIYLRDRVKGTSRKLSNAASQQCSQEAELLFTCLEENNFLDSNCAKELKAFLDCDGGIQESKRQSADKLKKGERVDGKVHSSVINEQLKKYSNPISKEALTVQRNLLNTLHNNRVQPVPHKNKWNPHPKNDNGLALPD